MMICGKPAAVMIGVQGLLSASAPLGGAEELLLLLRRKRGREAQLLGGNWALRAM